MANKQENKNGKNIWSYIVPYLLIAVTVTLIVVFSMRSLWSGEKKWAKSDLTYLLRLNTDSQSTGQVYIKDASVSQSYTTTTVTGTAVKIDTTKEYKVYRYTVSIENDDWNNATNGLKDVYMYDVANHKMEITMPTETITWSQVFENRIAEYNDLEGKDPKLNQIRNTQGEGRYVVVDPFRSSWWGTWGPTLILLTGTGLLIFFLMSKVNSSVSGANKQAMDFNKSPARREDSSKVKFDDVAGCDAEKQEMVELVDYLKQPKKYSECGAKLPKGCLLIGPPGTGKTLLAKAVAGEAGVPFFSISGSDFVEMFVGVGAGRVRDLFKSAKAAAPCIVFIDEIDAVGRQRGAGLGGGNDEREQTLNQLLVEMDGFEYNKGILVIAATNRDDVLDPALLRPGRFDRIITVNLPDASGREAIFKVHAKNKKIAPDVDFQALAKRTVGFSGADIANILNEAAILAVRFKKEQVGMAEIDEAIDRRIAGPAKSNKGMNEYERRQVAYHEAGHAVIGLVLPHSDKVQKITIIPRGNTGGHVLMTPEDDRFMRTEKELKAQITGLLGGRSSEEFFFDDVSTGASNDIQEATRIARSMVTEYGMSALGPIQYEQNSGSVFLGRDYTNTQKNFSSEVAYEIDKAVREIVESCHAEALRIIKEHKDDVTLIAETLLENETITAEQIDELIKNGTLPEKQIQRVQQVEKVDVDLKDDKIIIKKEEILEEPLEETKTEVNTEEVQEPANEESKVVDSENKDESSDKKEEDK